MKPRKQPDATLCRRIFFAKSDLQSLITSIRGGGRGVEIGGSRVVHGVAAVAEQGSRGFQGSSGFPYLISRASLRVIQSSRFRRRSRYLEPPKVGFTMVVDLWFARG